MKTLIAAAVLAFGSTTALAQGAPDRKGCTPLGGWITMPNTANAWIATMTGTSSAGTYVVDAPHWEGLPPGIRATTIRGVWQRRNGNTFDVTEYAFGVDPDGTVQFTLRIGGYFTLGDDCDTMVIHLAGEALSPDQNPVTGVAFESFPVPDMTGDRMKVAPPPEVQQ